MNIKPSRLASTCLHVLTLCLLAFNTPPAPAQEREIDPGKRVGIRLRSFVNNASGSMYFEPTRTGGIVRLTTLNVPYPEELLPGANVFVVWAVASGETPLRVGSFETDASGNGGLEFPRPSSFERYSVLVTAEPAPNVERPYGAMVFASRAGAVTAFYGERKPLKESRRKSIEREFIRGMQARHTGNDFYAEVQNALNARGDGGRTVELFGDEIAPDAHGLARLAARNENIYIRTIIRKLPHPTKIGASTYVLWGVVPGGRLTYMGSLPAADLNDADTYVRVGGFRSDDVDLFVTAEARRPVPRPSGLRAISSNTLPAEAGPSYGAIEGRVVDLEGNPVTGALVDVRPIDQPVAPDSPTIYTDADGRFFLDGVTPGSHMIFASKEEEGYPSTYLTFFIADLSTIPKVAVGDRRVTEGVLVRLGPKAARLSGHVVDAETGRPVPNAEVYLYRSDGIQDFFSFGVDSETGEFRRLIPPVPVRVKVSAPGYEEWSFNAGGGDRSEFLHLAPDSVRDLEVMLRPIRR